MIGQPFICMDYYDYDGRTLQEIIEGGPLGVGEAMEVVHRGARCGWPPRARGSLPCSHSQT